jgi:hypothetical protein
MQRCHEGGYTAARPVPRTGYPEKTQVAILQHYIRSRQMEK